MAQLDTREKLEILADAAKYDASCASSGTTKRNSKDGKGLGSTEGMGICHAYAPDGRCISLLKILLTNSCIFDCHYCINRKSSNVRRARFTAKEVVDLTIAFYKRNYIEGLFLSSGIIASSNYTMEQMVEVARSLREDHHFRGYIHLKTIPDADPELVHQAGLYADRVSINVELPTANGLKRLAPEKDGVRIETAMAEVKASIIDGRAPLRSRRPVDADDRRRRCRNRRRHRPEGLDPVRPLRLAPRLLFRVQPDPRCERRPPPATPAADARAPPLSVRLADALLRISTARGRRRCR
jgi:putative DNA modification/repair radical SAM protein